MHIRVEGKARVKEIAEAIKESLNLLEGYGIESISDVNLYFAIYDENGEESELIGPDYQDVGIVYKVNKEPKQKSVPINSRSRTNPRIKIKPESRSVA